MYKDAAADQLIPLQYKSNLTLQEAAAYTGLTEEQLEMLTEEKDCNFVLWWGSKQLFRREKLNQYLDEHFQEREEEITDF